MTAKLPLRHILRGRTRIAAVIAAFLYAWIVWAPSLAPLAKLRPKALAACAMTPSATRCQCLLDPAMGGHCCCKHSHDDEESAPAADEACAKLRACGDHAPQATAPLPNLGPHAASRAWIPLPPRPRAYGLAQTLPIASPSPDPAEKVPI